MQPVYETLETVPDPLGSEGDYWLVRKWVNAPATERSYLIMNQHGQVRFISWCLYSARWAVKQLTDPAKALSVPYKFLP